MSDHTSNTSTSLFSRLSDTARFRPPVEGHPVVRQLRWFGLFGVLISLAFAGPLAQYARYAWQTELYSHVFLIPFISAYMIGQQWSRRPVRVRGSPLLAIVPAGVGVAALQARAWLGGQGLLAEPCDHLFWQVLAWLSFLWSGLLLFLGTAFTRTYLFPLLFLVFVLPMPSSLRDGVEIFLQHASAEVAAGLFWLTGTTSFRDGLIFQLPGLTIMVAQECSGVRSTYVLFIVSWVAGYWFLRSYGLRAVLVASVLPLAVARNAFRIVTISLLTLHVDPRVIDSPLHTQGGPIFFALSMVPFLALVWWLRRCDQKKEATRLPPGEVGDRKSGQIKLGEATQAKEDKGV
ncbi:MAG: exosortase/archaeosortase family protein [Verrucomicrobiota bacterium]|nr:archaeosortase/exosortase family protein [Limisphaera sp.]MDW8380802.1 exosortase/archaeosortase family protein [Verrucomicrobiota bacterium]